jgi:hypothetical protein
MKNGTIVRTWHKKVIACLGLSASEIHEAWEWVIAFEDGAAWGCFRIHDTMWFMRGLYDAPSVSVTCGPRRGKGIWIRMLCGRYADWFFRKQTDGVIICSAAEGFGSNGFHVNGECIRYSGKGKFFGKTTYSSSVCDVIQPGPFDKSWNIIVKNDGQEMLAACMAYYLLIKSEFSTTD